MIDTKIACQCGNRFKFGMDLVNGRAPDGLICPTCGAAATPACNALVDFLSGKEPATTASGPRPVKEVKVTCTCGARYKFDLELAEKEMPSPVQCPGCQADLTPLANEEIRSYIAKHDGDLARTTAAAPAPAAVTATASEAATPPTPATPAVAPAPATSDLAATASPQQPPVATPAPVAAVPPSAAPAPTATPPADPVASTAPAATPPTTHATPVATPVLDPFGPAPTGKSTGPNLRPLEAPKITRPPPGTTPAKPATAASPASAPKVAKPDAAKPVAKPAAKPVAASREPSLGLGVAGAVAGAAIGAALWFVVLKTTSLNGGFLAPVLGTLTGFGARLLGRGASPTLGGVACISAGLAIGVMAWLAMAEHVNRQMRPQLKGHYDRTLAEAKLAAAAKTDAELKLIVARSSMSADPDGSRVTDADIKMFRTMRLPKMLELATGKVSREQFESRQLAEWRSSSDWMDVWQESLGMLGLIWMLAGVGAAARIALR